MPSLSHFYQTSHNFLFIAQDTAQYDLLDTTSEWTQMSVTGRGSLPLNWGCIQGEEAHNSLWAQFFGRDTIQPPTQDKNNNINLGNTGSANGIINHVRQDVQAF